MIIVEADGFQFSFEDAIAAFVFDEKDKTKPNYHGVPMKGVDIVAEFEKAYIFVEMKDFNDKDIYDILHLPSDNDSAQKRKDSFKWLKNYLKYKFRDSLLYRYAEEKVDKTIHYICLLTFDNALNSQMKKALKKELPVGQPSSRWKKALAKSCQVLNVEQWNTSFPKWNLVQLSTAPASPQQ